VEVEFTDLYVSKEESKRTSYLWEDYNIKSINLAHALLLLKLHGGAEIDIVTLPPDEPNYSPSYLPRIRNLLDFLDEIGCNVFINSKLHSKLILANDLALLGSFNLSSSALYDREEIGLSINDLDDLAKLDFYCYHLIRQSKSYGFSGPLNYEYLQDKELQPPSVQNGMTLEAYNELLEQYASSEKCRIRQEHKESRKNRITRGWLLDYMIHNAFQVEEGGERYREFFDVTGDYHKFIKSYSSDLNVFYLMNLRRLISSSDGKDFVVGNFNYKGDKSPDSVLQFLCGKFARKTLPSVKLRTRPL
jgi:hypothetical protein